MRHWLAASAGFFGYVILVTPLVRGLGPRARWLAAGGAFAGLLICGTAWLQPPGRLLGEWFLPPLLLLLGYWTSGLLFAGPMPVAERVLREFDARLGVDPAARVTPAWLAELLEFSYAGVYPLIPVALLIHLATAAAPDPHRFWTVVLVTDFVCFGFLPWVQTRPPRALQKACPWTSRVRRFNLQLIGTASIQANTFPSGHAAEALAAALLVSAAPWPFTLAVGAGAVLVSAGAVLGRYHYAADAIAGWMVALGVWLCLG